MHAQDDDDGVENCGNLLDDGVENGGNLLDNGAGAEQMIADFENIQLANVPVIIGNDEHPHGTIGQIAHVHAIDGYVPVINPNPVRFAHPPVMFAHLPLIFPHPPILFAHEPVNFYGYSVEVFERMIGGTVYYRSVLCLWFGNQHVMHPYPLEMLYEGLMMVVVDVPSPQYQRNRVPPVANMLENEGENIPRVDEGLNEFDELASAVRLSTALVLANWHKGGEAQFSILTLCLESKTDDLSIPLFSLVY